MKSTQLSAVRRISPLSQRNSANLTPLTTLSIKSSFCNGKRNGRGHQLKGREGLLPRMEEQYVKVVGYGI
jgi:hypothetical protein